LRETLAMADESKDVRCVQLSIFLSTDNPVVAASFFAAAGDNRDEVVQQPPRFQTSERECAKTVCTQLLDKLAKAIKHGSETIRIQVTDGGIIVPDPERPATGSSAASTHRSSAAAKIAQAKLDRKTPDKKRTPLKKKAPASQQAKVKHAEFTTKAAAKKAEIKRKPGVKRHSEARKEVGVRKASRAGKKKKSARGR
jgi:hypothetical protein